MRFIAGLIFFFCATALSAQFTFDEVDVGETTPLTLSSEGVSAHFSSATEFFVFEVDPINFAILSGNALVVSDDDPNTLNISFSRPVQAISLLFALQGSSFDEMFLTAYLGGSPVGTASASGFVNDGFFFPEGAISFENAPFDSVALSSSANNFAIDSVNADLATVVPEPSSALLTAAAGLALAAFMSIRNRAR